MGCVESRVHAFLGRDLGGRSTGCYKQCIDILKNMPCNSLRSRGIFLLDIRAQCGEIVNRFWRPDRSHHRLGTGRSLLLPHDATHSLTRPCATPG